MLLLLLRVCLLLTASGLSCADAAATRATPAALNVRGPAAAAAPLAPPAAAPPRLRVHLVSHSHCDVGWLKSPDAYLYGVDQAIVPGNVRLILDNVVDALALDSSKYFTWVETFFLRGWWLGASPGRRAAALALVASGQLSFAGGGYVMHDEAATTAVDMVRQTALGHAFLAATFGAAALPSATVQWDPFGHSSTHSSLLGARSGMPNVFMGRVDYADKATRVNSTSLEVAWRASPSLGAASDVFAHVTYNLYFPPDGLCWGYDPARYCDQDAYVDDAGSASYNAGALASHFVDQARAQAAAYRGDDILVTLGADFAYENPRSWFASADALMAAVNANASANMELFYSTPSRYAAAKRAAPGLAGLPSQLGGDFFPYGDFPHGYLTGFYSSRPALKGAVRAASALASTAEQLVRAPAAGAPLEADALFPLLEGLAIAQHHDGITGTSRAAVAADYARRLAVGAAAGATAAAGELSAELGLGGAAPPLVACLRMNETLCDALQAPGVPGNATSAVAVVVYNPRAQDVSVVHRVPIALPGAPGGAARAAGAVGAAGAAGGANSVSGRGASGRGASGSSGEWSARAVGPGGADLPAQLVPLSPADAAVRALALGGAPDPASAAGLVVWWLAVRLSVPAAGYASFVVERVPTAAGAPATARSVVAPPQCAPPPGPPGSGPRGGAPGARLRPAATATAAAPAPADARAPPSLPPRAPPPDIVLSNGAGVNVTLSGATGEVSSFTNGALSLPLTQSWRYYVPAIGLDGQFAKSGAYIFRPNSTTTLAASDGRPICVTLVTGPLVSEAWQAVAPWLNSTVRLAVGGVPELEWTIGPVPYAPSPPARNTTRGFGREVVSVVTTPVRSGGAFFTDANGRDLMPRVRNERPFYNYSAADEPAAANYYPVPASLSLAGAGPRGEPFVGVFLNPDRASGGASLAPGALELMAHRRLLFDDELGVGEALNDTAVARGSHRVFAAADADAFAEARREDARSNAQRLATFVAPVGPPGTAPAAWLAAAAAAAAAAARAPSRLAAALPRALDAMTLRFVGDAGLLVRLAHAYGAGEHGALSANATVDLGALLAPGGPRVVAARETWATGFGAPPGAGVRRAGGSGDDGLTVTIGPLDVRTFVCELA